MEDKDISINDLVRLAYKENKPSIKVVLKNITNMYNFNKDSYNAYLVTKNQYDLNKVIGREYF